MFPAINVSAEVHQVEKKSAADIVSLIGNSLPCTYEYNGTPYSTSFTYEGIVNANNAWRGLNVDDNQIFTSVSQLQEYDFIIYSAPSNVDYASFGKVRHVHIGLNMYFESYARGGFAMTSPVGIRKITDASNSISAYPDNYAGTFRGISGNTDASVDLSNYYGVVSGSLLNGNAWDWRPILYKIQSGGGFSGVYFDNVIASYDSKLYFGIWCPYVGGSIQTSPPVETTTVTSETTTSINVNVDVNLNETNGILSGIKQGIDNIVTGIINGLKALFIPSDDFMDGFKSDMQQLLEEHLGGLYEAEQIMVDSFEQFPDVAAKSEIYIPPAQLPLGGETFSVGGWHVPLKVSGLPSLLYDGIAFIIDFLCIAAFLRMCRNKLEIFLNPDSEVIQS